MDDTDDRATCDAAITIRVTQRDKRAAERLAASEGVSLADVVRRPFLRAVRAAGDAAEGDRR